MTLADTSARPARRPRSNSKAKAVVEEARSFLEGKPVAAMASSPTMRLRLPTGRAITVATDRVRAAPAVTPTVSGTLGNNAIGLGVWGLLFPRSVNSFLGLESSTGATRLLFGARELATGMRLFSDPTDHRALWARVAGDAFDIAVLKGLDKPSNPQRRNARLALGVVLAVTALDVIAAVRMTNVKRTCP